MAPPGEEGWTIRDHRAILHSEPYASANPGAASDVDGQVLTVRGCVGLFAEPDLTPTPGWGHLIDAGAKRPWPTPSARRRATGRSTGQERSDDSAGSAHARWLFGDHVNSDVHHLCAPFRSHEQVRPHNAEWSPGRASHHQISPIKCGLQPIMTAQGRIRGRMPILLSLSTVGRSNPGNSRGNICS